MEQNDSFQRIRLPELARGIFHCERQEIVDCQLSFVNCQLIDTTRRQKILPVPYLFLRETRNPETGTRNI